MLELSFVRDNIPQVEAMLRARGANPDAVLKDFRTVEAQRRQAINSAEELKAHRNRLSEEVAKRKRSGEDAADLVAETKNMRLEVQELEKAAQEYDTRLSEILVGIPNVPHADVPLGQSSANNVEVRSWGTPPEFDF